MKFDNATLNSTWARIVAATERSCGTLPGTGIKHVHDALISYTGLKRSTTPKTPGDYLKGIAVCARHLSIAHADKITCPLSDIAVALENFGFISTDWYVCDVTWAGNFIVSNGYLHVGSDPWNIVRADSGTSVGWVYPDTPFSLLLLDTRTDYYVVSGVGGGTGCRLVSQSNGEGVEVSYLFLDQYFEENQMQQLGRCEPNTIYYLRCGLNTYSAVSSDRGEIWFANEDGTILMSGCEDWSPEIFVWSTPHSGTYSVYRI